MPHSLTTTADDDRSPMFFRRSTYTPTLRDIRFHRDDWRLEERTADSALWMTPDGDASKLQLTFRVGVWPFDLRDEAAAHAFYARECEALSGAMIELSVRRIRGFESLVGVFKYRSPAPGHLGMYYVGIVWLPFETCTFQINFESLERGTTGAREAAVALIERVPPPQEEPELLTSMEAFFERARNAKVQALPSDARTYDDAFPEHPLSKVRRMLTQFETEAVFDRRMSTLKPYRVGGR